MSAAADALGVARLLLAAAFPAALAGAAATPGGAWMPVLVFALAGASDFLDGIVARRAGAATRHGAVLDNVADFAFVLAAAGAGTWHGLVSWAVPAAIALAVGAYVLASIAATRRGGWRLARSRVGHAGGVLNYALAGLVAGAVAMPALPWGPVLRAASLVVVAVNLAAVLERLLGRR